MNKHFIKVVNPELAEKLIALGFQYMQEINGFVFTYSDELVSTLEKEFDYRSFAINNRLTF